MSDLPVHRNKFTKLKGKSSDLTLVLGNWLSVVSVRRFSKKK